MVAFAIAGLALMLLALVLTLTLLTSRPNTGDAWRVAGTQFISDDAEKFYLAYIWRYSLYRRVGGIVVTLLCAIWAARSAQSLVLWGGTFTQRGNCPPDGCINTTTVSGSLTSTVVFAAVLGCLFGGLLAETYRLRAPAGPRLASLDARPPRPMLRHAIVAWAATAIAMGMSISCCVAARSPSQMLSLLPGLFAVALAEAIQSAIASRRRLVLTSEAMAADRNVRRAVSQSVTWTQLGAAILCLGWGAMQFATYFVQGWLMLLGFVVVVPALVCVHKGALARGGRQPELVTVHVKTERLGVHSRSAAAGVAA